jgi:hypothetical protein
MDSKRKVTQTLRKSMPLMAKKSMPLKMSKFAPARRLTKKEEGVQHLKDLANPTVGGLKRTILREQTKKAQKKAGEEWSRLRREKPSSGLGVGY